ncbi:tRNA (guanine-N(7)-)-methyltransferase non-catalytic subunit wdr4 [Mustelus asterias]
MLLAVAVSPDSRYVITADRDEKIRVSLLEQPYIIQAFCLGHHEFVSELSIPLNHPHLLVSGSGDGTVRLWEYENGKQLHCLELSDLQPCESPKTRCAVVRLVHCRGADFFAVLCDNFSAVYIVELDVESGRLIYRHTLTVKQRVWDMAFDDSGGLWVLTGDMAVLYQLQEGAWQEIPDHPERTRIKDIIRANWPVFPGSTTGISYNNLYKMSVDNMTEYQLKKQQRIDQRQTKRKLEALELGGDSKRLQMEEAAL